MQAVENLQYADPWNKALFDLNKSRSLILVNARPCHQNMSRRTCCSVSYLTQAQYVEEHKQAAAHFWPLLSILKL